MTFAEELTLKAISDEYWLELKEKVLKEEELSKKEYNDTLRFIDLLTLTENEDANKSGYETLLKMYDYLNKEDLERFKLNIEAKLSEYKNFDFDFSNEDLEKIVLERKVHLI